MQSSPAMRRRWRGLRQIAYCGLWVPLTGVAVVALPTLAAAQAQTIGHLKVTRQVFATRDAVSGTAAPQYAPARDNQGVFAGQGVRTLRRSQAEIDFNDKSILRIGERTDVVVQDTAALRRIQLQTGLVWVRVAKGVQTQVETPSATAVARGTQFTVATLADGSMILTVYEGTVAAQANGKEVLVHAGEQVYIQKGGDVPAAPRKLSATELPEAMGGSYHAWWDDVADNAGLAVMSNTTYFTDMRIDIAGETLQMLSAAGLMGNEGNENSSPGLTPEQRATLLHLAQNDLAKALQNTGLSLDQYRQQHGQQTIAQLFPNDATTLAGLGITNVDQFIQSALDNGASVTIPIGTRAYYQPGSLKSTPNFDINLLDRTRTSDSILAIGAAAALAANAAMGNKWTVSVPKLEVSGFGMEGDPVSTVAGRASLTGLVGKTRYKFESNVLDILHSDPKLQDKRFARLASVAEVEQTVSDNVTLFAGRRRFYHGPVFVDINQTQLIADRYSSAGLNIKNGPVGFEGAYLYDANPAVAGAQKGGLGSLFYRYGGGEFGAHYIHVPELTGKDGYTGSFSYPVVLNRLDLYGEAGRGPDKAILQTYGFYLPSLFQKLQTDMFVEYGSHTGIGRSVSVVASRSVGDYVNFRAFANFSHYNAGGKDTTAGIMTLIRFGN